jgi:hypothetical protein
MKLGHFGCVAFAGLVLMSIGSAQAGQYAIFSQPTDTISVAGNLALTNQATYEATVLLNSTSYPTYGYGTIFESLQGDFEDEHFAIGNSGTAWGYSYPVNFNTAIQGGALATGVWYNLAYVYDGSHERIYVNGNLAASRAAGGNILQGPSNTMSIGANFPIGTVSGPSFIGEIQSLRISDTARYDGSSYTATLNDFTSDPSTLLLFNFDQLPVGSTTISDLSGNGHNGTFGVGAPDATSPSLSVVPEPTGASMLAVGAISLLARRPRRGY